MFKVGQKVSFPRSNGGYSVGTIAIINPAIGSLPADALIRWTERRPSDPVAAKEGKVVRSVEYTFQKCVPLHNLIPA